MPPSPENWLTTLYKGNKMFYFCTIKFEKAFENITFENNFALQTSAKPPKVICCPWGFISYSWMLFIVARIAYFHALLKQKGGRDQQADAHGEEKALDLPIGLYSYPYLWSRALRNHWNITGNKWPIWVSFTGCLGSPLDIWWDAWSFRRDSE